MGRFFCLSIVVALLALPAGALQCFIGTDHNCPPALNLFTVPTVPVLASSESSSRLVPALALQKYQDRAEWQMMAVVSYSDETVVKAELPRSSQKGEFVLVRKFSAPKSLAYSAVRFVGDGFVKTQIINRLLQSEVEHVQKGENEQTAITEHNYKFTYHGTDSLNGHLVYVYQVKPRTKRPELFKGKIFIDAYTGRLRRATGRLSKSPSWFVKRVDFVQDYTDVGEFTFLERMDTTAAAHVVGTTMVTILHRDYRAQSYTESPAAHIIEVKTDRGGAH